MSEQNDPMGVDELAAAAAEQLHRAGAAFTLGALGACIPGVMTTFHASIDEHVVRFDFCGPAMVVERTYLLTVFDVRTKQELGTSASATSAAEALGLFPWRTALQALRG